jgi:site-specific DNA recombinase
VTFVVDSLLAQLPTANPDSTLSRTLESVKRMQRAVLYARVSSDLQQKEGTIQTQVAELQRQIAAAGDTLVTEYIDDGYSGALLDRPAMNQLRDDLKAGTFDAIYFLAADRISREVTYQNIIIAEMLRYKKQIIINGRDYIHNPENKFTLTVLGAVAETSRYRFPHTV